MVVSNRLAVFGLLTCVLLSLFAEEIPLSECREKAAAGDAEALWQMGLRYEEGRGVAKNAIRAVTQYKKSAEQGHRKACEKLSELYSRGELVKKDVVLAAKYRALADGGNVELAVAKMTETQNALKVDDIEMALDYLLGRNGKERDPKTGIRVLFAAAKDRPIAQRIFVKRWCAADLDDALDVLTDDELKNVVPWFEDAYKDGITKAAYVLGLFAYEKGRIGDLTSKVLWYSKAEMYWRAAGKAGVAHAWYLLGRKIYLSEEKDDGCIKMLRNMSLLSDAKAKDAFQLALRQSPQFDEAKWQLGLIYLFSKDKRCADSQKAFKIFADFYNRKKGDKWNVYYYGYSGWAVAYDAIKRNRTIYEKAMRHEPVRGQIDYEVQMKRREECMRYLKQMDHYNEIIKQAADMGCEPAQKFVERQKKDS